ncbi:MAG TPA: hypothetical protein PKW95_03010 [bacterium]|nr:hypothetical protein [bacterium]
MRRTSLIVLTVLLLTWLSPAAAVELLTSDENPIRGQATTITLQGADDPTQWTLTFTYRPNSKTSRTTEPQPFNFHGKVSWKPNDSGIVQIAVQGPGEGDKISKNVAVRFPSPPASGIVILLIAGAILFGGAGYSLAKALKQ